jgi:transposase
MEHPMSQPNDLSRSLTSLEQDSTIIAVIEMSQSSWLVAGIVPGIERHPLKKLEPSGEELVRLLMRWRAEATKIGRTIMRIAVAFEAGRDGFWLARWLRARDIETYDHPPDERGCIARASPRENRSTRHWIAQTRLHRLVAW